MLHILYITVYFTYLYTVHTTKGGPWQEDRSKTPSTRGGGIVQYIPYIRNSMTIPWGAMLHHIIYIYIWSSVPPFPGHGHGSAIVLSPSPPCGVVGVWYCRAGLERWIYIYIYINMYICVYIYIFVYICTYLYIYIYKYVWLHVITCIYIYVNAYIYAYIYTHVNIRLHIYIYIHIYLHVYVSVYCTYVYIYTYMYL